MFFNEFFYFDPLGDLEEPVMLRWYVYICIYVYSFIKKYYYYVRDSSNVKNFYLQS